MTVNTIKELPKRQGMALSNQYQVKAFRDNNARGEFLSRQCDNQWKELNGHSLKSGTYSKRYDTDRETRATTITYVRR